MRHLLSRRESLISPRRDDLLAFPTDESPPAGLNTHDIVVIRRRAELPALKRRSGERSFQRCCCTNASTSRPAFKALVTVRISLGSVALWLRTFVLAIAKRAGYLMDCQHEVVSKAID